MFKQDIAEMEGVFLVVFPLLFNISGIQRAILKLILSYIRAALVIDSRGFDCSQTRKRENRK